MSLYLLDTNICVHLLKGEYAIKDKIASVGIESCFLSEITIAELLFGIENSSPTKRDGNLARFENFEALFSGRILPITQVLSHYAKQKADLRRAGKPVGEFDLLIGATAVTHGMTLVTRNIKDFENIEGIIFQNWIVER
ncbi:MAG: tRNA(fMet)-specific endonuclease VapC [Spirosomataceae bacterium]|jgi:tRNA(fMet)-specific endonuclease VapC